jgi:hypothetical protein
VSHTYPVPGTELDYPAPRHPGLRLRVVPNESLSEWWEHLGELVQELVDEGSAVGISIELDTSDRTRPNEMRGGASPVASIALVILGGAGGALGTQLVNTTANWVRRHLPQREHEDPIFVTLYDDQGNVLKRVRVEDGEAQDDDQGASA